MQISVIEYLKEKTPYFIKVIRDNKKIYEDSGEVETVSNSEEEIKKKGFI